MFGKNEKKTIVKGDGSSLDVHSIFTTFQGEGPFVGWPSIFIRLAGCNLACSFCDTEFDEYTTWNTDALVSEIKKMSEEKFVPLVIITGGEPFRQPIELFCQKLLHEKFEIQIETNGTLYRPLSEKIHIICSPKTAQKSYFPIHPQLLPFVSAFKFLVSATMPPYDTVPDIGQALHNIPVYVQPMDEYDEERNRANRKHTLYLAEKHRYRLSLQTHKIWNIE